MNTRHRHESIKNHNANTNTDKNSWFTHLSQTCIARKLPYCPDGTARLDSTRINNYESAI